MSTSIKNSSATTSVVEQKLSAESLQGEVTTLTQSFQSSTLEDKSPITFVNTSTGVIELLEDLADLPTEPPSLYIDLEGVNLSRHGTVSILQIFVYPKSRIYLIDIHTLRADAFSYSASNGSTLRSVLESRSIPKVFFDVRNDSDALFSHYQIELSGVQDLQLMEIAQRQSMRLVVNGLDKCIEHETPSERANRTTAEAAGRKWFGPECRGSYEVFTFRPLSDEIVQCLGKCIEHDALLTPSERANRTAAEAAGRQLFAPECGGSYEVFNIRPLSDEIIQYCAQDVQFLPKLWHKYRPGMTRSWEVEVEAEVQNRIQLSKTTNYNAREDTWYTWP